MSTSSAPSAATVLFVSSNGTGMGHLTRLTAMARRSSEHVAPQFVSMSRAVPIVADSGYPWQYIPSRLDLGIGPRRWNRQLTRRMVQVLERERPQVLVFDGTFPYDGIVGAAKRVEGTKLVWSRRPMWRKGGDRLHLTRSSAFDLIIEPGELAEEFDRGSTVGRTDARKVDPITLLDASELVSREEAAAKLGVDPSRPTALVTLGAGNIRDLASDRGAFVARLLEVPDLQIVVTQALISQELAELGERVHSTSVYPISRYFRAVDFAVAAAGYNSFHELVGFGVPTAFVPNPSMPLDDQPARARWAEQAGAALCVEDVTAKTVEDAVSRLSDPVVRAALAARCAEVARPNGAGAAMGLVESLLEGVAR